MVNMSMKYNFWMKYNNNGLMPLQCDENLWEDNTQGLNKWFSFLEYLYFDYVQCSHLITLFLDHLVTLAKREKGSPCGREGSSEAAATLLVPRSTWLVKGFSFTIFSSKSSGGEKSLTCGGCSGQLRQGSMFWNWGSLGHFSTLSRKKWISQH